MQCRGAIRSPAAASVEEVPLDTDTVTLRFDDNQPVMYASYKSNVICRFGHGFTSMSREAFCARRHV